jgi:protein-export membrane protein SecD
VKERLPLLAGLILVLAIIGIYANLDKVVPGFQYAEWIRKRLTWQGEEAQRSLALREGLDLVGGLQVLMQVNADSRAKMKPGDLDRAAGIIEKRVNALGVTEPLVQTQGADKIVVQLPGVADPELAKRTIGKTALLEFIYAGAREGVGNVKTGDHVYTTWGTEGKLFEELPADQQKPFQEAITATGEAGLPGASPTSAATGAVTATATVGSTMPLTATAGAGEAGATSSITSTAAVTGTGAGTAQATSQGAAGTGASEPVSGTEQAGAPAAAQAVTTTAGVTESAAVSPTLGTTGTLGAAGGAEATSGVTTTTKEEWVFPTVITGDYLTQAAETLDNFNNPAVSFMLSADGGSRMQRFTADHMDEIMAIALDGELISTPFVRATIADSGQITGNFSRPEAQALAAQLQSGALPISLDIVGETLIGPTLGRQFVHDAVKGGIVGMLVVICFMLVYYRFPGLLADLALLLYVLFTLTVFRLLPITLTLAGIAGFILSIGIAVDANILIFERMKEELRSGRRIHAAMDTGFARAWPSIRDSNFSTIITCVILFWFGSQFGASIVKGFALTLALGVLVSLFTAITVTRTLLLLSNKVVLRDPGEGPVLENRRLRLLFGF